MFIIMDVREGNFSEITSFSQGERLMENNTTEHSSSYLFLMLVFQINSFSMTKEKNELEFIKTRQDSTIRRKVTRKKKVKFAILLDCLFIC